MVGLIRARFRGDVTSRGEAGSRLERPGDLVVVQRARPRLLVVLCPDGCGAEVVVNVDPRAGSAWELYRSTRGVSVYPSIWREDGCRSHFVIWNGRVFLFQADEEWSPTADDTNVRDRVEAALSYRDQHYSDVAARIGEVPWAVLAECEALLRKGRARRGAKPGTYSRIWRR